jgi:hypothetical protein
MKHLDAVNAAFHAAYPGYNIERRKVVAQELLDRWAASDKAGNPDYGIYDHDDFWMLMFECFEDWTCRTATRASTVIKQQGITSVLDVHGGLGHAAVLMAMQCPETRFVVYIEQPRYRDKCNDIALSLNINNLVASPHADHAVDAVTLFEVLEHFVDPVALLQDVLKPQTRFLLECSAYESHNIGHHRRFRHLGQPAHRMMIRYLVRDWLKKQGFEQMRTATRRPNVFARNVATS